MLKTSVLPYGGHGLSCLSDGGDAVQQLKPEKHMNLSSQALVFDFGLL